MAIIYRATYLFSSMETTTRISVTQHLKKVHHFSFSLSPIYPLRTHSGINHFLTLYPILALLSIMNQFFYTSAYNALFACLSMQLLLITVGQGIIRCLFVYTTTNLWCPWVKEASLPPSLSPIFFVCLFPSLYSFFPLGIFHLFGSL